MLCQRCCCVWHELNELVEPVGVIDRMPPKHTHYTMPALPHTEVRHWGWQGYRHALNDPHVELHSQHEFTLRTVMIPLPVWLRTQVSVVTCLELQRFDSSVCDRCTSCLTGAIWFNRRTQPIKSVHLCQQLTVRQSAIQHVDLVM